MHSYSHLASAMPVYPKPLVTRRRLITSSHFSPEGATFARVARQSVRARFSPPIDLHISPSRLNPTFHARSSSLSFPRSLVLRARPHPGADQPLPPFILLGLYGLAAQPPFPNLTSLSPNRSRHRLASGRVGRKRNCNIRPSRALVARCPQIPVSLSILAELVFGLPRSGAWSRSASVGACRLPVVLPVSRGNSAPSEERLGATCRPMRPGKKALKRAAKSGRRGREDVQAIQQGR